MANRYYQEIRHLLGVLSQSKSRAEATQIFRSLIDRIVVTPTEAGDRLTVDLIGDLAGILWIATQRDRRAISHDLSQFQPVKRTNNSSDQSENAKIADKAI